MNVLTDMTEIYNIFTINNQSGTLWSNDKRKNNDTDLLTIKEVCKTKTYRWCSKRKRIEQATGDETRIETTSKKTIEKKNDQNKHKIIGKKRLDRNIIIARESGTAWSQAPHCILSRHSRCVSPETWRFPPPRRRRRHWVMCGREVDAYSLEAPFLYIKRIHCCWLLMLSSLLPLLLFYMMAMITSLFILVLYHIFITIIIIMNIIIVPIIIIFVLKFLSPLLRSYWW